MKQKYNYRKLMFPIRMDKNSCNHEIEVVDGWTTGESLGLHKNILGKWVLTDLFTGTRIVVRGTRDACIDWYKENSKMVYDTMQEPWYIQRVMEFRALLEKERKEIK